LGQMQMSPGVEKLINIALNDKEGNIFWPTRGDWGR